MKKREIVKFVNAQVMGYGAGAICGVAIGELIAKSNVGKATKVCMFAAMIGISWVVSDAVEKTANETIDAFCEVYDTIKEEAFK